MSVHPSLNLLSARTARGTERYASKSPGPKQPKCADKLTSGDRTCIYGIVLDAYRDPSDGCIVVRGTKATARLEKCCEVEME